MENSNKGSITFNKSRYSDRMSLVNDGTKYILAHDSNRDIKKGQDWAFSCFVTLNDKGSGQFHVIYNDYTFSNSFGLFIAVNGGVQNLAIATNGVTLPQPDATLIPFGSSFVGKRINITCNYDNATNSIDVYLNGSFIGNGLIPSTDDFGLTDDAFAIFSRTKNAGNGTDGMCESFWTFDRKLTVKEIELIERKNSIPNTLNSNCNFRFTSNQLAKKINGWDRIQTPAGWDAGVLFTDLLADGSYLEATVLSMTSGAIIGLTTTLITPVSWNFTTTINYGVYANLNSSTYQKKTDGVLSNIATPRVVGDVIRFERSGTTITILINGVIVDSFTGATLSSLKPCIMCFSNRSNNSTGLTFTNVNIDGVEITDVDESIGFNDKYPAIRETSADFNFSKVTGKKNIDCQLFNYLDEELGINTEDVGIKPTLMFKDYYDKENDGLFGIDMGFLWSKDSVEAGFIVPNLNTATIPPTVGFANGFTITVKGNFSSPNVTSPNPETILFFDNLKTVLYTNGSSEVYVSNDWQGVGQPIMTVKHKVNRNSTYTLSVTNTGLYTLFIDGIKAGSVTDTYVALGDNNGHLLGVAGTVRYYKLFAGIRYFDFPFTDTQGLITKGSELNTLSPIAHYSTWIEGGVLKDNLGNAIDATGLVFSLGYDLIVESKTAAQPKRLGLIFDSSQSQHILLTGMNLSNPKGLTFVFAVKEKENIPFPEFKMIFSKFLDASNLLEIKGNSLDSYYNVVFPNGSGSSVQLSTSLVQGDDLTDTTLIVFRYSEDGDKNVLIPYSNQEQITSCTVNGFRDNSLNNDLGTGGVDIDSVVTGELVIGKRANSPSFYYDGVLLEAAVYEGIISDEEVNNEIYSQGKILNPSTEFLKKHPLEFRLDINNPFVNGPNLEFPDFANKVTAQAINWSSLLDIQNSREEIK